MNKDAIELIIKAEETHELSKAEIAFLLQDNSCNEALFNAADRVRIKYVGDEVHLRGLIEFSNTCKQNCHYCGLRRDNKNVTRYRLEPETIIDFAEKAASYGYKTVVLQSGEDPYYTSDIMCSLIKEIKKLDLAITLSIGEKTREEYAAYRQAGADRFLLRIETTNKELYEKYNPGMSFENRLSCLYTIKELGYETGTGCLIGIPGQTEEDLAGDIMFFRELGADMIGVGPFIPNHNTPLGNENNGEFELALKVMSITRLLLPDINIPATTAMETLNPNGRILALKSGANVVMPNVTEGEYRKFYELYPGKICVNDTPAHCRQCISGKIGAIGRKVSTGHGFREKKCCKNSDCKN